MHPKDENTLTIACRTMKNLKYIYAQKDNGEDVEEFTQLINSMLGIVISLREEYFKGSNITWDDVKNNLHDFETNQIESLQTKLQGHICNSDNPNLEQANTFSKLMSNIRHAFAHNNFKLLASTDRKITGLELWNILDGENNDKNRIWESIFEEDDLLYLIKVLFAYLEQNLEKCSNLESQLSLE